jgi:hypothetical protein
VGPRVSVFLWMRLSVRGEFALHNQSKDQVYILDRFTPYKNDKHNFTAIDPAP